MQKKLIALAIAGLSGAAFAQSNVQIYGVADADWQNVSATGGTQNAAGTLTGINQPSLNRMNTNSSILGFKGSEALGNGMTAVFQMESYVDLVGPGSGQAAGGQLLGAQRDTFVGLAGGFGTVALGYLSGPYRNALVSFEMMPGATGNGAAMLNVAGKALTQVGAVQNAAGAAATNLAGATLFTGGTTTTATRIQNTAAYITPNFSGLQGVIAYSTGPLGTESKTTDPQAASVPSVNPTAWTAGLNYDNGPLMVRFAYQAIKSPLAVFSNDLVLNAAGEATGVAANNRSADGSKIDSWILGAGYKFGSLQVNLAYDHNKATASGTAASAAGLTANAGDFRINDTTQKTWLLSGKYVAGANEFAAEYARTTSSVNGSWNVAQGANTFKGQNDQGASAWTLRYSYNLSKRSSVYAYWTEINNQANAKYDFTVGKTATAGNGDDPRVIGAGIRHVF